MPIQESHQGLVRGEKGWKDRPRRGTSYRTCRATILLAAEIGEFSNLLKDQELLKKSYPSLQATEDREPPTEKNLKCWILDSKKLQTSNLNLTKVQAKGTMTSKK